MIISEKQVDTLFSVYDPLGLKLLMHVRLELSHLNEQKFRYDSNDTLRI